ncbi:MAG: SufE family protein [Pseudomonadota bacterium]|nr:SufE family protein [Pseudomonadota bacterium]
MVESSDINETTQDIIGEFSFFDDWIQRYEYIIEMGKALKGLPEDKKDEAHKVAGCQSQVWFYATQQGDKINFDADSDAMIVRGLIALLLRVYSNRTPKEIMNTPAEFFEVLDLGSHLSGSRANGLHAMIKRIHAYAKAYEHEQKSRTISPEQLS